MPLQTNLNREQYGPENGYKNVLVKETNEVLSFPINMSDSQVNNVLESEYFGRPTKDINPSFYETEVYPALEEARITGNNQIFYDARRKQVNTDPFWNNLKSATTFGLVKKDVSETALQRESVDEFGALAGDFVGQTAAIIATAGLGGILGLGKAATTAGTMAEASFPQLGKLAVGSSKILPKTFGEVVNKTATGMVNAGGVGALYEGIKSYIEEGKKFYDADPNTHPEVLKIGEHILKGGGTWSLFGIGGAFPAGAVGTLTGASAVAGVAYGVAKMEGGSDEDAVHNALLMSVIHTIGNTKLDMSQAKAVLDHVNDINASYIKAKNKMTGVGNINGLTAQQYSEHIRNVLLSEKKIVWEKQVKAVEELAAQPVKEKPAVLDGNKGEVLDYLAKYFEPKEVALMTPERRLELFNMDWRQLRDVVAANEPFSKVEADALRKRGINNSPNEVSDIEVVRGIVDKVIPVSKTKKATEVSVETPVKLQVSKEAVVASVKKPNVVVAEVKVDNLHDTFKDVVSRKIEERKQRLLKQGNTEQAGKEARGKGYKLSAILRNLRGEPTEIEYKAELNRLEGNYAGKRVSTKQGNGEVVGTAYGKIRVKLENGEVKSFEVGDIKSEKITKEEIIKSLQSKAEASARGQLEIYGIKGDSQPKQLLPSASVKDVPVSEPVVQPVKESPKSVAVVESQTPKVKKVSTAGASKPSGTGELKESTLFQRVSKNIENMPESEKVLYRVHKSKETFDDMVNIFNTDRERFMRIATFELEAPKGMTNNDFGVFLANHVDLSKDFSSFQALQKASEVSSRFGQEIQSLANINKDSPVAYALDLAKERKSQYGNTEKFQARKAADKVKIEKEIKIPKREDWAAFIESIKC